MEIISWSSLANFIIVRRKPKNPRGIDRYMTTFARNLHFIKCGSSIAFRAVSMDFKYIFDGIIKQSVVPAMDPVSPKITSIEGRTTAVMNPSSMTTIVSPYHLSDFALVSGRYEKTRRSKLGMRISSLSKESLRGNTTRGYVKQSDMAKTHCRKNVETPWFAE